VSNPSTYNTAEASVTLYFSTDSCVQGTHTVTWCTGTLTNPTRYALFRNVGTTCSTANAKYADYLTGNNIFIYLPPNSHATSLGGGTGSAAITTQDGSSALPRLHVDLTVNQNSRKHDAYRLFDDIAFRNGVRACSSGVASC
jgi:hypothetical protein